MPAVSQVQREFMAICEHDPGKARGKCPSKKVAHEFAQAPIGRKLPQRAPKKAKR